MAIIKRTASTPTAAEANPATPQSEVPPTQNTAAANRARIEAAREAEKGQRNREIAAAPSAKSKSTAPAPKAKKSIASTSRRSEPSAEDRKITEAWRKGRTIAQLVKDHKTTRPAIRRAIYRTLPGGKTEFHALRAKGTAGGSAKRGRVLTPPEQASRGKAPSKDAAKGKAAKSPPSTKGAKPSGSARRQKIAA